MTDDVTSQVEDLTGQGPELPDEEEAPEEVALVPTEDEPEPDPGVQIVERIAQAIGPKDLAYAFAQSGYFKDVTKVSQALVKIAAGQELGIGPFAAMEGFDIIEGQLSASANLAATKVKQDERYSFSIEELTRQSCAIRFYKRGRVQTRQGLLGRTEEVDGWVSLGVSDFTMDDAQIAGLIKPRSNWEKWPRNMLFARAMTNGVKWFCPEVLAGIPLYTAEELGHWDEIVVEGQIREVDEYVTPFEAPDFGDPKPPPEPDLPKAPDPSPSGPAPDTSTSKTPAKTTPSTPPGGQETGTRTPETTPGTSTLTEEPPPMPSDEIETLDPPPGPGENEATILASESAVRLRIENQWEDDLVDRAVDIMGLVRQHVIGRLNKSMLLRTIPYGELQTGLGFAWLLAYDWQKKSLPSETTSEQVGVAADDAFRNETVYGSLRKKGWELLGDPEPPPSDLNYWRDNYPKEVSE